MSDDKTYRIVRFHREGDNEIIVRGLTLAQAKAHCNRDDAKGEGWFDGFVEESGTDRPGFRRPTET